jgi:hypothetical protein
MAIRSLKSGTFSRSGMVGNPVIMPGSYESIATINVGAGAGSSITFSSIPSTYQHLQIRYIGRRNNAFNTLSAGIRFNNDSGTNYVRHELYGDGSTMSGSAATGLDASNTSTVTGTTPTSTFGVGIIDILDYTNTNKYKTFRQLTGADTNGAGFINLASGLWLNTSAINSITMLVGSNWEQYSSFALYGVN